MEKSKGKMEIFDKIEKVLYVTQPSPIVLISTIDRNGINNLAPFGMFMNCSSKEPQMIAVAISPKSDTYTNIKDTKHFVVGIPKEEILEQLYKAGDKFEKGVDEFEITNLTPYDSKNIGSKKIKECRVNIECVFENEMETGNHNIVVGKVVGCDIDEEVYSENKVELRMNMPAIYHITSNKFLVNNQLKEIEK